MWCRCFGGPGGGGGLNGGIGGADYRNINELMKRSVSARKRISVLDLPLVKRQGLFVRHTITHGSFCVLYSDKISI